ncbi:MAG: hypothetical protein EPO16_06810 [Dehalococcoidia bacterium]|nr:MAG: hypothetical protein EPO16_06810 [Dehalococcoidia bacterium]
MKRLTWIALVATGGLLAASVLPVAADGIDIAPSPPERSMAVTPADSDAGVFIPQVSPAHAGNRGIEAADAAVGSAVSLSSIVLVAVFGSRWLVGRRR